MKKTRLIYCTFAQYTRQVFLETVKQRSSERLLTVTEVNADASQINADGTVENGQVEALGGIFLMPYLCSGLSPSDAAEAVAIYASNSYPGKAPTAVWVIAAPAVVVKQISSETRRGFSENTAVMVHTDGPWDGPVCCTSMEDFEDAADLVFGFRSSDWQEVTLPVRK